MKSFYRLFRFVLFSILTASFFLSLPVMASSNTKCVSLFSEILHYRLSATPTQFGIDFYLRRQPTIGAKTVFKIPSLKMEAIKPENYFTPAGEPYNVVIKAVTGKFMEARDPLRSRFFVMKNLTDGLEFTEIVRPEGVFPLDPKSVKEPHRNFSPNAHSVEALALALADSQSQTSSTARYQGKDSPEYKNLVAANTFALGKAKLSREDIEKINEIVNVGTDNQRLFSWPDLILNFGTMRGFEPKLINRRVQYFKPYSEELRTFRVDLSTAEMMNGELYELYYTHATHVKGAIEKWIQDFNAVGIQSSLREILGLYQRFIVIHPFVEGNGRTSRILLDIMLMRAGFAPVRADQKDVREILYRSLDDLQILFNTDQINVP